MVRLIHEADGVAADARAVRVRQAAGGDAFDIDLAAVGMFVNEQKIVTLLRPFGGTELGGDISLIDTAMYVENTQSTAANAGLTGPAQSRIVANDVRTVTGPLLAAAGVVVYGVLGSMQATLGEIADGLRGVYGEFKEYSGF